MTASKNAAVGTYKINVEQLATSARVISGEISLAGGDSNKKLGIAGSFTIANEDYNIEAPDKNKALINITADDTLNSIATKFNDTTKKYRYKCDCDQ